ncbi:MAG: 1-acyl-sn-glycerol-3-phosphate acyltransferase [Acidimicrobiia bacterium]
MYAIRFWLAGVVARVFTVGMFQDVEIEGSPAHDGPRLIVANHFGGLVDAIVVVRAIGGLPHIVAKSTLFKRAPLRIVLKVLGVVPVYRQMDHADLSKNQGSFDEVAKVLAKGRTVLIFPEGTVTDSQELQHVRTGAARMATAGIEAGAENLAIVPIGITYEDKVSSRSRVLVEVGEIITEDVINADAEDEPVSPANRPLVHALTDEIRDRLRAVAPDYGSLIRERTMMLAASTRLRTSMTRPFDEPPLSDLRDVAQALAHATSPDVPGDLGATSRYYMSLTASGLEDHQIQPAPTAKALLRLAVIKAVILVLIAPFALFGLMFNLIPILLVIAVGAFVKEPVSKGTARVVTGVVVFPVTWIAVVAISHPDYQWLTFLLLIVGLILLIVGIAQLIDLFEALAGWWAVRKHAGLIDGLLVLRSAANDEISAILGDG